MTAAELECRWAARRLDIQRATIRSVKFVEYEGFCYSTLTEEPATKGAEVKLTGGSELYIDLDGVDFGELLRELIAA